MPPRVFILPFDFVPVVRTPVQRVATVLPDCICCSVLAVVACGLDVNITSERPLNNSKKTVEYEETPRSIHHYFRSLQLCGKEVTYQPKYGIYDSAQVGQHSCMRNGSLENPALACDVQKKNKKTLDQKEIGNIRHGSRSAPQNMLACGAQYAPWIFSEYRGCGLNLLYVGGDAIENMKGRTFFFSSAPLPPKKQPSHPL